MAAPGPTDRAVPAVMRPPAAGILPYGHRQGRALSRLPLDALNWPLGRPDLPDDACVADLGPDDHVILYLRTKSHFQPYAGIRARVSVMMLEPSIIHGKHLKFLRLSWRRFHRILCFNDAALARFPNAVLFPFGTTWVPEWRTLDTAKTAMCSLIASSKRDSQGHRLRHDIAEWTQTQGLDVALMGRGYRAFGAKSEGLAPYRYSVVIENTREPNYFTEKLVDAVLCDTVPIYWGCPNLDRFFDTDGIIQCRNGDDLKAALSGMSLADYGRRQPQIARLKQAVGAYADIEARAASLLLGTA